MNETSGECTDIASAWDELGMLEDGTCSAIEAFQILHTMDPDRARGALREWKRLLAPGGTLIMELPDLTRCLELIGDASSGWDAGLVALFGYSSPAADVADRTAKWAWSPDSLASELEDAGFEQVALDPACDAGDGARGQAPHMRMVAHAPETWVSEQEKQSFVGDLFNIFAWPNYADPAGLDHFFNVFARVLVDQEWACLRLRVDPELDPDREAVIAALEQSHARVLGNEAALNVALFEGPITPEEWIEVGESIDVRVQLDHEHGPRGLAAQMKTKVVLDARALFDLVQEAAQAREANAFGSTDQQSPMIPEATLEERVEALHPWDYPVTIAGKDVQPGVGTGAEPTSLAGRVVHRSTLLVQELLSRIDFRDKSVLDVGSNCGFWSSFYAMAGATRVLGIDKEMRHVAQAELSWGANRYLPIHSYEFAQADVSQAATWQAIGERGEFDVTVCADAFNQIENQGPVLEWIARATRECFVLDTRVHDGTEGTAPVQAPNRAHLLQTIQTLGFEPEILSPEFSDRGLVEPSDSYSAGSRIVILARRIR